MLWIRSRAELIFFFNDTATTEIYTLSLHDALPICRPCRSTTPGSPPTRPRPSRRPARPGRPSRGSRCCRRTRAGPPRSEEHTSELQSRQYLVCRLLLEKKKNAYVCTIHKTNNYAQR